MASSAPTQEEEKGFPFGHPNPRPEINDSPKAIFIPNEISLMILRLLPTKDIKSVRLVSKAFSELGAGLLCRLFTFRPDQDDYRRFQEISDLPLIVSGVKCIRFEVGTMDIYHAVRELTESLATDFNNRLLGYKARLPIESKKYSAILEYARWNVAWRQYKQDYRDIGLLESVLRTATSLKHLAVSKKACSFRSIRLLQAYGEGSVSTHFQDTNEEFVALLLAVERSNLEGQLKSITHDQLPVTFFNSIPPAVLSKALTPFQYLATLNLTFDANEPPYTAFWKDLGTLLRSATNLVDLRFGFHPLERFTIFEAAWHLSTAPEEWYLPLWKFLGEHVWPKLEDLRLDGLLVCESGLIEMLRRHTKTLKRLHLCDTGLWDGSFRSTLCGIGDHLKLTSFEISGATRAFHALDENWRLWPTSSPFPVPCPRGLDYYTKRSLNYFIDPPYLRHDVGAQLSRFVLRNGAWPLSSTDALTPAEDDVHDSTCEGCIMDRDEIDEEWAESNNDDLSDWEVSDYAHLVAGVDYQLNDDVCEVYDENGYDEHGFDRAGFHASGLHYSDPLIQPDDAEIADGRYVALKKDILSEIKKNIPRYENQLWEAWVRR